MSLSLYDVLKKDVKKMTASFSQYERGNIYPLVMNEVERALLELVLEETKYNYVRAARALGIGRATLYRRIEALGIVGKKGNKGLAENASNP